MPTCQMSCLSIATLLILASKVAAVPNAAAPAELDTGGDILSAIMEMLDDDTGKDFLYSSFRDIPVLKSQLQPMLSALPDNGNGKFGYAAVRYVLHRLFVQRHGWFVEGLDAEGLAWIGSSPAQAAVLRKMPKTVQEMFDAQLSSQGLSLADVAVLAATIEHLVHKEATDRLRSVYTTLGLPTSSAQSKKTIQTAIDAYMGTYVAGLNPSTMSGEAILELVEDLPNSFLKPSWPETRAFVKSYVSNETQLGHLDFDAAARAVSAMGEDYGKWQNKGCLAIKKNLLTLEDKDTGRVPLRKFYDAALNKGMWEFVENREYLRSIGALDDSIAGNPRVIIPNYLNSPSNCLAASDFYSVCCISECEDTRSSIEAAIGRPDASPDQIFAATAKLSNRRVLPRLMQHRLKYIAQGGNGKVPLYGRLFAQWLHHAFPRECPYPYLSGAQPTLTQEEWEDKNPGSRSQLTKDAMEEYLRNSAVVAEGPTVYAKWTNDEELIVPVAQKRTASVLAGVLMV